MTTKLCLVVIAALVSSAVSAQTITPNVMPAPPGNLVVVNNGAGDQTDPHVAGDLVSYSNSVGTSYTVRYFNLASLADAGIPNSGTFDFLADVSGSVVAFTRVSQTKSAIFTYDTSTTAASAVEVAPLAGSNRQSAQIGAGTIAWQDFGFYSNGMSDIVAYDVTSATTTRLTSDGVVNESPAVSPDGAVLTWTKCQTISSPCDVWDAVRIGTAWTIHQLTNAAGNCSHPDSNGLVVVYSCDRGAGDRLFWQPIAGGVELGLGGSFSGQSAPSIAGRYVSFAGLAAGATAHDLYVFDLVTSNLYQITNTPVDEQLSDISIDAAGRVNVAWQVQEADLNVYAYSFNQSADDLLDDLVDLIDSFDLSHGITTSLDAKLQAAVAALAAKRANDLTTACNDMTAFVNSVAAQSGNMLTVDQANQLIAAAEQIKSALGCP